MVTSNVFQKFITIGCFAVLVFLGNNLFASEDSLPQKKSHIIPSQLRVLDEGLFVEIKGELYQVSKLKQKKDGLSVTAVLVHDWLCVDGHFNWNWRSECHVCGKGPRHVN
ncbi:MAG: hypothetical protein KBC64_08065 [Simkaniaceae bacterium]|nr:hypothetical protein [Simkaniaceae bacterium]